MEDLGPDKAANHPYGNHAAESDNQYPDSTAKKLGPLLRHRDPGSVIGHHHLRRSSLSGQNTAQNHSDQGHSHYLKKEGPEIRASQVERRKLEPIQSSHHQHGRNGQQHATHSWVLHVFPCLSVRLKPDDTILLRHSICRRKATAM